MAFDMYSGERHESIRDQDEFLFTLAEQDKRRYPVLLKLWANFYSEFVLVPQEAATLVHELLALHDRHEASAGKSMASLVLRLAKFFSAAAVSNASVRCAGD
jgi:hypothetical protein